MATRIGASRLLPGLHHGRIPCYRHTLFFLVFLQVSIESTSPRDMQEDCQVSITGERTCVQRATECQVSITGESTCPQKVIPSPSMFKVPSAPSASNANRARISDNEARSQGLDCLFSITGERFCTHVEMHTQVVNTRKPLYRVSDVFAGGHNIRINFREGDDSTSLANNTCWLAERVGTVCKQSDVESIKAMLDNHEKHFRSQTLGGQIMERMRYGWQVLRKDDNLHDAKIQFAHAFARFPKSSFISRELTSASLWPDVVSIIPVPDGSGAWYYPKEPKPESIRRHLEQFALFSFIRFQAPPLAALVEQEKDLIDAGAQISEFMLDGEYVDPLHGFPFIQRHRLNHDLQLIDHLYSSGYVSADVALPASAAYRQVLAETPVLPLREGMKLSDQHWNLLYPFHNRRLYVHPNPAVPNGALSRSPLRTSQILYGSNAKSNGAIGGQLIDGSVLVIDNLLSQEALAGLRDFSELSTVFIQDRNSYLGASRHTGFTSPLLAQIAEELQQAFPDFLCDLHLANLWAFKFDDELQTGINVHADSAAVNVNLWITPDEYNLDPDSGGLVVYDARVDQASNASFEDYNSGGDWSLRSKMLEESGYSNVTVPYRQNRAVIFDSARLHKTQDFRFKSGVRSRRINITFLYGARGGYCMLKRRLESRVV